MPIPFPELTPAAEIGGVLERIASVIAWSIDNATRVGYFAALYERITRAVGAACDSGRFQDAARMQRLDTTFANRYFAALNGYFRPEAYPEPSRCWRVALDAAALADPILAQHMLAGVNAHIGLDLGIAAYQTARPGPLEVLHADFMTINAVITEQVRAVLTGIDTLSPVLAAFYDFLQKYEVPIIDDGIVTLRDDAWRFASFLGAEIGAIQGPTIAARDLEVAGVGTLLFDPPQPLVGLIAGIARRESRDVPGNVQVLRKEA